MALFILKSALTINCDCAWSSDAGSYLQQTSLPELDMSGKKLARL
jgi:hypothetical protein